MAKKVQNEDCRRDTILFIVAMLLSLAAMIACLSAKSIVGAIAFGALTVIFLVLVCVSYKNSWKCPPKAAPKKKSTRAKKSTKSKKAKK